MGQSSLLGSASHGFEVAHISVDAIGRKACLAVVDSNASDQVTWVHSYVSAAKKKTFCTIDLAASSALTRQQLGWTPPGRAC
jgi:hypothetical protein